MSYNTPTTRATGYIILATNWNEFVANFIAMAPDAFTADGDIYIASGANEGVKLAAFTSSTGVLKTANGGLQVALADPNADRILFWDDSAGAYAYLTASTNLTISGTTLTADAPTEATSSDMADEGTSNANRYATPEVMEFAPGACKAYASMTTAGVALSTYNTSTAKTTTGQYAVTITGGNMANGNYALFVTAMTTGADRWAVAAATSVSAWRVDTSLDGSATDLLNSSGLFGVRA